MCTHYATADGACVIDRADYPPLIAKTFIEYEFARELPQGVLDVADLGKHFTIQTPVSDTLFLKIVAGMDISELILPNMCKKIKGLQ